MILEPIHAHDKEFILLHDEETVVGRKECCVLIEGDPSISRAHAKFCVQLDGTVFITDLSKYGTSVNNRKLNKEQRYQLKEGDLIKFGNQPNKSEFRLQRVQWVFCCSNMNASQKMEVKKSANKLGGKVVDVWNGSCTHLIMDTILVTVKVVNALSSLKPIVTPKWLEDCVTAITNGNTIPDHADYLPEVVDQNCNESKASFLPDESRSYLLSGKVFYFLTEKQYNRLNECITNGGGICRLATSEEKLTDLSELISDNALVMSVDSNTLSSLDHNTKEWVQKVFSFVKSKGYRAIVDSEVGLALLRVSTEKDCNPLSHQVTDSLPPPTLSQQRDVGPPLAGSSLGDITVYANDTLFGSEPSEALNSTPSMLRTKKTHKPPVKKEVEEEEPKDIPISLSIPSDAVTSNSGLTQSSTGGTKYFEPQEDHEVAASTNCAPVETGNCEEKIVPIISSSPDGLSCSPSTFHSSLPSSSTSVIVPGTFTQKSNKETDVKTVSNFFSSRKRKKQLEYDSIDLTNDDDVVDLTMNKVPSPKAVTNTSIFSILQAKRQKRGNDAKSKASTTSLTKASTTSLSSNRKPTGTTNERQPTKDNNLLDRAKSTEAADFELMHSLDECSSSVRDGRPPPTAEDGASSVNDGAAQEFSSMDVSDSQRPVLSRFQRFSRRKTKSGFISARVTRTLSDELVTEPHSVDDISLPVAPAVLCEQVSLVVQRAAAVSEAAFDTLSATTGVANFKRFKKARYRGMGGLPTIIGTTELSYFDGETTTLTQEWQREHEEHESSHVREEAADPFEMSTSRRKR